MDLEAVPAVTIVIPNYNGRRHLERLLPSITNQTCDDYEIIIIDDCSPDRSAVEYIRAFIAGSSNMRLVENDSNLGFVKTCNRGFRMARSEYVCLLTNDTEVTRNFVERHLEILAADQTIGVLACVVVDSAGDNWFSGGLFSAGVRKNLQDDFEGVRPVDWAAGTAPFYRRKAFEEIGYLSEGFVMYHEDIDFCLRLRKETDFRVCMFSDKLVTHYIRALDSATLDQAKMDRLSYYGHRNHIRLLRQHCPRYLPRLLTHNAWEIAYVLVAGGIVVPIIRLRPSASLFSVRIAVLTAAGTIAGLIGR